MKSDVRRLLTAMVALGLVLAACSSASEGPEPASGPETTADAPDESTSTDAGAAPIQGGCPAELAYPCTYASIPDAVLVTQAEYSTRMRELLESQSREAAHAWVSEQAGVIEAHLGDGFIAFRLEGGMPYMIATPLDEPDPGPTAGVSGSHQTAPELIAVSLTPDQLPALGFADVVGRDTHRENPQNHKSALFLEPWGGTEGSLFGAGGRVEPKDLLETFDDYQHPDGVIHRIEQEVGPEWFTSSVWRHYDFIYVSTHAGTWDGGASIETGIRREWDLSSQQKLQYCEEMLAPYVGMVGVKCGEQYTPDASYLTVDLDLAFFIDQFRGRGELIERAIVYIEGCETMLWPNLAKAIVGDNSIYLGWSAGINLSKARESSGELLVQMTKRQRNVMQALAALCASNRCGGERFKDPDNPRSDPPWLIPYAPDPEVHSLRLYDLPKFKNPESPTSVLENGAKIEINGKAGDDVADELDITVDLVGVIDPNDTSGDLTNVSHGSPADRYRLRFFLGEDEVLIGEDILGSHIQPGASVERLLPFEDNRWRYSYTANLGFDLDPDGLETRLKVEVSLPEGGVSHHEVDVELIDGGTGATIAVGGQVWEFELTELMGSLCIRDETSLLASGAVDGDQNGVTFSAVLTTEGGELVVDDYLANAQWMAAADRDAMTVLHLVPDGQSQIDSIEFDDRIIRGEATFIETIAFHDAWLNNTAYPTPVPGSFEIRCPSGS